jgi:hypothetical protein
VGDHVREGGGAGVTVSAQDHRIELVQTIRLSAAFINPLFSHTSTLSSAYPRHRLINLPSEIQQPSLLQDPRQPNYTPKKTKVDTDGASRSTNIRARVCRGDAGRDAAGVPVYLVLRQLGAPNGEPFLWLSSTV